MKYLKYILFYICNLINNIMKKKFGICLVTGYFEKFYSIFSQGEYDTCMAPCEVVYESDNFFEIIDEFAKYKNIKINK